MEVSWLALLRLIHVAAAAAWFGAVVFGMLFLMPTLQTAGEAGRGFMAAVQKRGGFGRFMGPVAISALVSGAILYYAYDYHNDPFASLPAALLTVGGIIAIAGWTFGMLVAAPIQRKTGAISASFGATGPTPEQAAHMKDLQAKMMRYGPVTGWAVILAFLLMAGRAIVT